MKNLRVESDTQGGTTTVLPLFPHLQQKYTSWLTATFGTPTPSPSVKALVNGKLDISMMHGIYFILKDGKYEENVENVIYKPPKKKGICLSMLYIKRERNSRLKLSSSTRTYVLNLNDKNCIQVEYHEDILGCYRDISLFFSSY